MIWILLICGIVVAVCIYNLYRNSWVYKLITEMDDVVYKYNMNLIKNGTYDNKLSYSIIPTYNFMLYCQFYNWNRLYFNKLLDEKVRMYEKSII